MKQTRANPTIRILMVVLLAGSLLSACGQKGPLYLPDKQQQDNKAGKRQ